MRKYLVFLLLITTFTASSQYEKNKEMTKTLKNKDIEIQMDMPLANYNFSRFDWTGKIVSVKYKDIYISGREKRNEEDETKSGKGFYNEFGIDAAIGFDETNEGEWFHKIGVGLLKKEGGDYLFSRDYKIQPAEFNVVSNPDKISISCKSPHVNGYSYELRKEIVLTESGFVINYYLKNTGEKTIITTEYDHNFIAINNELVSGDYLLKFPFNLRSENFEATVNPEGKVEIGKKEISFNGTPDEQFFFSNISGNESVEASWELVNTRSKIGIRETGSFKTNKVNVWGWTHVISPELFFDINIKPGEETEWSRTYNIFELD